MINLSINGRKLAVAPGTSILEAAAQLGIEIPHYCYHPDIGVDGNCRMCLVQVGQNTRKLAISCQLPVSEGMEVQTESPAVVKARKGVLEFLLINHPLDCTICDQAGECPLQDYAYRFGPVLGEMDAWLLAEGSHVIVDAEIIPVEDRPWLKLVARAATPEQEPAALALNERAAAWAFQLSQFDAESLTPPLAKMTPTRSSSWTIRCRTRTVAA